jgi:Fic family protein
MRIFDYSFLDARSNYNIRKLLLIPCFVLDFLCVHPFADGNGRMSRLLPVSKQEICYILPDISPTTVEAALSAMLKSGQIEKVGTARNTKYSKK